MKLKLLLLVLLAVVLIGSPVLSDSYGPYFQCHPPERDTFGDAFRMARNGQILDPDAGLNLEPVEGLEADAAERVHEKYLESLAKKAGGGGGGTVGFVPLITGTGMGR